jgi:plastocyanin
MNRSACLALLALLVLASQFHQGAAAKVTITWAPKPYAPIKIKHGDTLEFNWAASPLAHGVAEGTCAKYKMLYPIKPFGKFSVTPAKGTHRYVCQVKFHCPIQQIVVTVV